VSGPRPVVTGTGQRGAGPAGTSHGSAGPAGSGRSSAVGVVARTLAVDDVVVGQQLPPLDIPLTRTLIVATAIASRDYQDVHHDPALAVQRGSPDIFMNILTTNGLVGRFVTDWAGPGAVLEEVAIRLGVPNYPGDTMRLTGTVRAVEPLGGRPDGRGVVEVAVRGANRLGDHVTGTVRVALPRRAAHDVAATSGTGPGGGTEPGSAAGPSDGRGPGEGTGPGDGTGRSAT